MSVFKRNGSWYFNIPAKLSPTGKRLRQIIREARTRGQAEQAESRVRQEIFDGRYGRRVSQMGLAKYVEDVYLPWAKVNKQSWAHDEYRSRTLTGSESLKGRTLSEITPQAIENFKIERAKFITKRGSFVRAGTINNELALLSRIFSMAVDHKLVRENPCSRVRLLPTNPGRTRYLTFDEETRLMKTSQMMIGVLRPIVTLAIQTGMRQGEILALKWADVDLARNLIFVAKPKWKGDKRKTKGIPFNSEVGACLLELQAKPSDASGYVFTIRQGRRPHASWIYTMFKRACAEAGIKDFRFHDLRHTFGTRLGEHNISPFTIAELMGHADIKMTARYTHPTEAGKRAAVECAKAIPEESGHSLVSGQFGRAG